MKKKLTKAQIDKQILDHADEIVRLMKLKGFNPHKASYGLDSIHIHCWETEIDVESMQQDVSTRRRKMK